MGSGGGCREESSKHQARSPSERAKRVQRVLGRKDRAGLVSAARGAGGLCRLRKARKVCRALNPLKSLGNRGLAQDGAAGAQRNPAALAAPQAGLGWAGQGWVQESRGTSLGGQGPELHNPRVAMVTVLYQV